MSLGDFQLGATFDFKFTTRQISGAPFTLGGTPVISAYPANSTTEITAGITLTTDFDGRTGLNHVRVVASAGNGFAINTNYDLVITAGTVNGVSVVGEVIERFSVETEETAAAIATALLAAASSTPMSVSIEAVNGVTLQGAGTSVDKWRKV